MSGGDHPRKVTRKAMAANYAFERAGLPSAQARVRLAELCGPAARLKRLRPAAQRGR
jgi:hypothetical protein